MDDHFEIEEDNRDYASRMDDILGSGDEQHDSDEDSGEGFVYDGEDAEPSGPYKEQLSEILEQNIDELDELEDAEHVGKLLQGSAPSNPEPSDEPEPPRDISTPSPTPKVTLTRPSFLHPNVSRLRSHLGAASASPVPSVSEQPHGGDTPSHMSALSRTSSNSNLQDVEILPHGANGKYKHERTPFRWSTMKSILERIRTNSVAPPKAASVLGNAEAPTVMAANGLICIGTTLGRVYVFDFKQNLKCICATKDSSMVSAIALSQDRTFVAVGHMDGQMHLFNLADPSKPVRTVPTLPRAAVLSGRREGHLHRSRITHIAFVGARHTAVVSSDEHGLVFYHSLGKVLFVEATDVLRLLGKYPEEAQAAVQSPKPGDQSPRSTIRGDGRKLRWIRQSPNILAMAPLPLGAIPNATDAYNIIAILTPLKLVIVALKPVAKTWLRKRRVEDRFASLKETRVSVAGCLSWYPAVTIKDEDTPGGAKNTVPTLVYTWGKAVTVLTVREELDERLVKSQKRGIPHEQAKLEFQQIGSWTAGGEIKAVEWLNAHQVLLLLDASIEVWDIRDGCQRIEKAKFLIMNISHIWVKIEQIKLRSYQQSICAYKGKIFVLGVKDILVGTLLSWTDHILGLVERGDSLAAIELATAYHLDTAPGNKNGLPRREDARKVMTGNQLRELMQASVRHAFSLDRLTDATHRTADNRGVDRTDLFEGLVPTCVRACKALDELDFLFEEVFEHYQNAGIERIYLRALEPFLLDGTIPAVPPWITQQLISMHEEEEEFVKAEALIWHLDPMSLDINQAIRLCREQNLWDALIYVYTRALRDYVAPIVELIPLVRKVQKLRQLASTTGFTTAIEKEMEAITPDAYKVFPYIAATLCGSTYPSQTPLPKDDVSQAKSTVYAFLIDGRSRIWPSGPSGKLILTADEDGGTEPTYPYLRLLLRFDPESMLHTLDLAFEDSYLNDDNQGVGRLIIIKILLEMLGTGGFPPSDATLVRIFVARNVPKYPQYIKMPPSLLHTVLVGLASDNDADTREDRQLATEYLLSVYKPREEDNLITMFEEAGFYRILRTRYKAEKQWSSLLEAYLQDFDLPTSDLFRSLDEVFASSMKKGVIPRDVVLVTVDSLPRLLSLNLSGTASLLDRRMPDQHSRALEQLEGDDERQLVYLRTLLQPAKILPNASEGDTPPPSQHVEPAGVALFFELLSRTEPGGVIEALESLSGAIVLPDSITEIFKRNGAHDAVVLSLQQANKVDEAISYIEKACRTETGRIGTLLDNHASADRAKNLRSILERLERLGERSIKLCQANTGTSLPADQKWLRLLQSQILLVQGVADEINLSGFEEGDSILGPLRTLVQESFGALLLRSHSQGISFPTLFKELVTSTTEANKYSEEPSTELYSEFRMILTGMLESYRYEGELLTTSSALVNRDVNKLFEEWTRKRDYGWRPAQAVCGKCHRSVIPPIVVDGETESGETRPPSIRIVASGVLEHVECPA